MKRIIRNACIVLAHITGISWVFRVRLRTQGPLVRVIVFHDVLDTEWFAHSIATLCTRYHVLTPADFLAVKFDTTRINVLITFDDGYASWVETCLPILEKNKVKALFFVNSGLLDVESEEEKTTYVRERLLLSKSHRTLTWDGARALTRAGHTVGGHTRSHTRLSELPVAMQEAEIKDDKARLTEVLDSEVATFAYPFGSHGDYTEDTMRLTREVGYTHAFTTNGTFADVRNPHALSRLCIEDNLSPRALSWWVEGGYDIYGILKKLCVR